MTHHSQADLARKPRQRLDLWGASESIAILPATARLAATALGTRRRTNGPSAGFSSVGVALALVCAATPGCEQPQGSHLHPVNIRGLVFQPQDVPVARGDTITWKNLDIVPHTVTADDASWDSGDLPPGATFTLVADGADTWSYVCRYHPTMAGRLVPK